MPVCLERACDSGYETVRKGNSYKCVPYPERHVPISSPPPPLSPADEERAAKTLLRRAGFPSHFKGYMIGVSCPASAYGEVFRMGQDHYLVYAISCPVDVGFDCSESGCRITSGNHHEPGLVRAATISLQYRDLDAM
jgi:hypothetical protein